MALCPPSPLILFRVPVTSRSRIRMLLTTRSHSDATDLPLAPCRSRSPASVLRPASYYQPHLVTVLQLSGSDACAVSLSDSTRTDSVPPPGTAIHRESGCEWKMRAPFHNTRTSIKSNLSSIIHLSPCRQHPRAENSTHLHLIGAASD